MIKKMDAARSLEAGQACLDGVVPVGSDRGIFDARVRDGKAYRVIAALGYGSGSIYCTCPYDGRGACRHVVAALLYALENFDELIRNENRKAGVGGALEDASDAPAERVSGKRDKQKQGNGEAFSGQV